MDTPLPDPREQVYRQMFATLSHDLKTPLATVIGSLEVLTLMKDRLTLDRRDQLVASALSEAHRLDAYITSILDMTRLEATPQPLKMDRHELGDIIEDAIIQLGPLKARGRIEVIASTPSEVTTDGAYLCRALVPLLDNALRHTGAHPVVTIEYGSDESEAFIHVRDHGPGIPEDKFEAIFSKYTRLERGDAKSTGIGLGLALSRLLVTRLSGRVDVRNHVETGAVFSLYLPVKS